ncbi:hypothetical protein CP061683_1421, partial [Chlamydia psittaci 06-1683]
MTSHIIRQLSLFSLFAIPKKTFKVFKIILSKNALKIV